MIDLGTMEIFTVWEAMQKGLIDQETGLVLLEAQLITTGLVVPSTSEKLSLTEGLARDIIDCRTHQLLQELQDALLLVDKADFQGKPLVPVVAAMEDGRISENIGLKILEVQLATGGFIDPSSQGKIGLEEALQKGMIAAHVHGKLASPLRSCKNLIDPNSAKTISLNDLLPQCIFHEETRLRLLPVKQLAGGMVSLTSDPKVSLFHAVQEGLIEKQGMVKLLEAQLFAGGIVDPQSGHRLTVDEAIRHNLIDQSLGCALLVGQLQTGGIIDTITRERQSLDEAVRKELISSRTAVRILESLQSFKGLLQPESGKIIPVVDALEQDILSSKLALKILSNRQCIKALFVPETVEIVPWQTAIDRGILNSDTVKSLKSICLPDVMPNVPMAGSPTTYKISAPSLDSPADHEDQSHLRSCEEKLLFYCMTHSYVNVHNGHKLLLVDRELSDLVEMHTPAQESESTTYLSEASKSHPQEVDVLDHRRMATMEAEPCSKLALTSHELSFCTPEKESERNLPSTVYVPKEKVEMKTSYFPMNDAGKSMNVKKQEREDDLEDFKNAMEDSKREQELMLFQSRHEMELPVPKKYSSFRIKSRDTEVVREDFKVAKSYGEEESVFKNQEGISDIGRNDVEKESSMFTGGSEELEDSQNLRESVVEHVALATKDRDAGAISWFTMTEVETGSIESHLNQVDDKGQVDKKSTCEHMHEQQDVEGRADHLCQIDSFVSPKTSTDLREDRTLNMLLAQLQNGGIINEQTSKKMLLDESIACGSVPSHTAVKLMGKMKMFSSFFDAETFESLTTEEVISEGLMDEKLLRKVLASDQALSGIIDPLSKTIYSIKDASEIGLLDKETAARILEGQVVTGGIVDFKRDKKMSVTLASNLGLIQQSGQEELKKLEKASKGKDTENAVTEKLIALQAEIGGIIDPKTKDHLTVAQATEKRLLGKEKAFDLLTKQVAEGGILHPKTGMRLSVDDAMNHGLVNQDFYEELKNAESICLHQYIHAETKELMSLPQAISLGLVSSNFLSKVQEIQASTGSIFDPVSGQKITLTKAVKEGLLPKLIMEKAAVSSEMKYAIVHPESCRLVPYSELIRASKIDVESGQRYLEVMPFRAVKDDVTGDVLSYAQAVKLGKVDFMPCLRLLQAQADTGGIIRPSTSQRLSLASALELEVMDNNTAEVIAVNQLLAGGIVDTENGERVTLNEATAKGLISKELAGAIQENVWIAEEGPDHEKQGTREDYQSQQLLRNGASRIEPLAACEDATGSNEAKQPVLYEAADSPASEVITEAALKGIQKKGGVVPPSLSSTYAMDSLASQLLEEGGKLTPALSLMLDPDAGRLKTQKKNRRKKGKLKRPEPRKEELKNQAAENVLGIETELENIVLLEKSVDDMMSLTINGGQEQTERKVIEDNRSQVGSDAASIILKAAQEDICLKSLEISVSKEFCSAHHREEEKVCIDSEEPVAVFSRQAMDETELLGPGSEILETPSLDTSEIIALKHAKKKKTKRNKKQDTLATDPSGLHESSQEKPSLPIPETKETLMRRNTEELTSGLQEPIRENTSGGVMWSPVSEKRTSVNRKDNQAFESETHQVRATANFVDDQKVNNTQKGDSSRELTDPKLRMDQDSMVGLGSKEQRLSQEKVKEPFMSKDQTLTVTAVDDTQSFGPPESKIQIPQSTSVVEVKESHLPPSLSFTQETITQEIVSEDESPDDKGLCRAVGAEKIWQVDSTGGKINGLQEQILQESGFPESKTDASRILPMQQNAAMEITREVKDAGKFPCAVEDMEERWMDAAKQSSNSAKVGSFIKN